MRPALARRLLLMTLLLVSLTLFATTLGAMRLPLVNLLPSGDDMLRHIWLTIRLPRVLLALLVGAALALSGCVMQGLFRNPLADPGLLGISSGAALAAIAQKLPELPAGSRILGFNYDTGERYLSVDGYLPT